MARASKWIAAKQKRARKRRCAKARYILPGDRWLLVLKGER